MYSLDARTGAIQWQTDTSTSFVNVDSSPTVANGVVYAGTGDGKVFASDAATGANLWETTTTAGANVVSSPTVVNGVVYIGSGDYKVYAFELPSKA